MSEFIIKEIEDGLYKAVSQSNSAYCFKVHPLDLSRRPPPTRLTKETATCLRNEIEKRGQNPRPRTLLGSCHKNAMNLAKHLSRKGFNPVLHVGCNKAAGKTSNNLVEVFKNIRNAHQWVSVDGYTTEICSEASSSVGYLYVSSNFPSNYNSITKITSRQIENLDMEYISSRNIEEFVRKHC
jgi:hypothetical protein